LVDWPDINITLHEHILTINAEKTEKRRQMTCCIRLPECTDDDSQLRAEFKRGVLHLILPKQGARGQTSHQQAKELDGR